MQFFREACGALVIAHPGHELRVHGWLEKARPLVFVLTDGSGRSGLPRLNSTRKVLLDAGAKTGPIFGRFTDAETYASILAADFSRFTILATDLAQSFFERGIEYVAGDASEGYNPAHDLCRLILNAAVDITRRRTGREILNFDFPLIGRPDTCHQKHLTGAIRIELDDIAFARKLRIAESYPELLQEVESTVTENGIEAFRKECLRPVYESQGSYVLEDQPFYERYGERQVAAGLYPKVLRYRRHMLPLAGALRRHVEKVDTL
jgi:hypothetical protein